MILKLDKTLAQIENKDWGEPSCSSHLVNTCHKLRKKPLRDFTVEDLRIMIGQNISLEHLIPLAIEQLKDNIVADGNYYAGDLLENILNSDTQFWIKHEDYWHFMVRIYRENLGTIKKEDIFGQIKKSFDKFINNVG